MVKSYILLNFADKSAHALLTDGPFLRLAKNPCPSLTVSVLKQCVNKLRGGRAFAQTHCAKTG
jgi:hypothetical protein